MIQGSMVALVTPMTAENELDWEGLHKLVDWHLEQGTHAIVAVGTTGESATLSVHEHLKVIQKVVDQINGRIPVIAGTGANSTQEAIELTASAKGAGADACLSVTPYYNKPTQEGLFQHHKAIAEAVALPQLLYNVPGRTGVDMSPETAIRLSKVDNIIGIKEATGEIDRVPTLLDNTEDFLVLSGDDETAVELMLLGGKGDISVTANVAPAQVAKMCELAIAGKSEEARAINQQLMAVHAAMFVEPNPIPVKWAVAEMGLMQAGIRLPMTPLAEQYHQQVRDALNGAGLL
ncbi:4-hydroxy-tetrahydrodipicolinate synthase [Pseudomaricurvus alkylphenolicus]|jgi:4-hydroxy-tetrahydrodipicolinate synthase|uniref:4-hydroxy-tetrahydrodipicolinate synthase n=1 Tax=Pseudomaricurvus alkylphenolicus TaxID=1306991 RepID=UPI001421A39F|nr:4-hydroxy-tetrahydrodipicolinate synthase [Pseudomaricurvus alkylphenolicus]NIB42035.1 4-hydroxy-tetrahydrodipicolinate synthase [Pseudomaricurvus alkylphenolicus]